MRWKGLIFIGVLVILSIIAGLLFSDAWLESKIESNATVLNGARVDIDNLTISFTGLYISWDRLQITNPRETMRNRIETADCKIDFEFWPLFSKKFIVETFNVNGIRTNTEREVDGYIEPESTSSEPGFISKTSSYLEKEVSSVVSPRFASLKKNANVDSIMAIMDIQSIKKITALQNDATQKYGQWEKTISEIKIDAELKKIQNDIKSIDVNKIKTPDQGLAAIKKVDDIYSNIKKNSDDLTGLEKNFSTDLKTIQSQLALVDNWIADDYKAALALAKIPQINAENISKLLFGDQVVNQINGYLGYVALARKYSGSGSDKKPEKKPARSKGQNIYFYNKNARPDFWVKNMEISGLTESAIAWQGSVNDLVSDQRQINKPTLIHAEGTGKAGVRLAFDAGLNYLKDLPEEKFTLDYNGFSLANLKIGNSKFLPNKVKSGSGKVQTRFDLSGDQINGSLSFEARKLLFDSQTASPSKNDFERIIQSLVSDISEITFLAGISGKAEHLKFTLKSNLDDLFAKRISALVDKEIEKVRKQITDRVEKETGKYRDDLNNLVKEKEQLLRAELKKYEDMVAAEQNRADVKKKEIESQYEKEKSGIEKKIKGLLKF